jgi:hypothetical protein
MAGATTPGLREAFRRVTSIAKQAGGGQHAGITRTQPVGHDLAAALGAGDDLDATLDDQQVIAARVALAEYGRAGRPADLAGGLQQRSDIGIHGGLPGREQLGKNGGPVATHRQIDRLHMSSLYGLF